ncbi:MAG: hypothetical protein M3414_02755, partial [Pseudomonadota bacterium]|nr:hypothetical protein [Pseudomonadota bacterium]
MYGKFLAAIGFVVLAASLSLGKPAHAGPASICQEAQLSGASLGLCNAYVSGQNCLDPSIHDSQRCVSIRRAFAGATDGRDLDQVLGSDSVRALVPSTGVSVTLPGIGTVTFPSDAFASDTMVEVASGRDASVAALFDEFASIFRPSSRLAYEVTVTTGALPPLSETFDVRLDLPADFLAQVPEGYGIEFFAILEQESDLSFPYKSFELFESQLTETGNGIVATVPGAVFFLDSDGAYKAVFTLAPTPGVKDPPAALAQSALSQLQSISPSTSQCQAASIACPVNGGCTVTS